MILTQAVLAGSTAAIASCHLYRQQIDHAIDLAREAETFRVEFNQIRPHEGLSRNRPADVHEG